MMVTGGISGGVSGGAGEVEFDGGIGITGGEWFSSGNIAGTDISVDCNAGTIPYGQDDGLF